jgi:hypothetical protein
MLEKLLRAVSSRVFYWWTVGKVDRSNGRSKDQEDKVIFINSGLSDSLQKLIYSEATSEKIECFGKEPDANTMVSALRACNSEQKKNRILKKKGAVHLLIVWI